MTSLRHTRHTPRKRFGWGKNNNSPMTVWRSNGSIRSSDDAVPDELRMRNESPFSPDWGRVWEPRETPMNTLRGNKYARGASYVASNRGQPETELQALMEARAHDEPRTTSMAKIAQREQIADAVDLLPPRLKWIFEARVYRGLSVRQTAAELSLGKSFVDRLYHQAVKQLQVSLADLVKESE